MESYSSYWSNSTNFASIFIINGLLTGNFALSSPISSNTSSRIVIGASLDPSFQILSGTAFDGYIRRIEIIDINSYMPNDLLAIQNGLSYIANDFVASNLHAYIYS